MRTELVTTLKRKATELPTVLENDRTPILITQHGLPAAYLVDVETYERQQKLLNLSGCKDIPSQKWTVQFSRAAGS